VEPQLTQAERRPFADPALDESTNGHAAEPAVAGSRPAAPGAARVSADGRPLRGGRTAVVGRRGFSIRTFESLKDRDFRAYFFSMLGEMSSMNMQMVVRTHLAFVLTGSYAALGTIALANAVPGVALALVGGALADRVKQRKWVVQGAQAFYAATTLVVGTLLLFDLLRFEHLLAASVVQGTVMALMMPSRQSMIPEIVGTGPRLMNAIALNAAGMNTMRLFAPALGGVLISAAGAAWVYFLMTGLYLSAAGLLFRVPNATTGRVHRPMASVREEVASAARDIRQGVDYMVHHPTIGVLLLVNMLIIVTSMHYMFMLAGFVADVLNEGPDKLGYLFSATGIGSLVGSLAMASFAWKRRGQLFLLGSAFQGGMLMLSFTIATSFWTMAPLMLLMGVGQSARQALSNVLVQTYVDDDYRGRVMSIYMMQFSLSQVGTFFVGFLAVWLGPRAALGGISGVMMLIALAALVLAPRLRKLE
jgi:MFS family permease